MILIISSETLTTCDVMDWLISKGASFLRVNERDRPLSDIRIRFSGEVDRSVDIVAEGKTIPLSSINAVFVRHGFLDVLPRSPDKALRRWPDLERNDREQRHALLDFIHFLFQQRPSLGHIGHQDANKLLTLNIAQELGIQVPGTLITTKKSDVIEFRAEVGPIICKAVQNVAHLLLNGAGYLNYTEEVSEQDLADLPDRFAPSKFQEKVEKAFEVRTFILGQRIYSMAILSQNDPQTSIDFRKYNLKKQNRGVPYQLPALVEAKLLQLMRRLGQKTASLDLVVTPSGRYVLLEVNPVGQFGMVSNACNYHLEEHVADFLIGMEAANAPTRNQRTE